MNVVVDVPNQTLDVPNLTFSQGKNFASFQFVANIFFLFLFCLSIYIYLYMLLFILIATTDRLNMILYGK